MLHKRWNKLAAVVVASVALPGISYAAESGTDKGVYFAAKVGMATLDDPRLTIVDSEDPDDVLTIGTKLHTKNTAGFGGEIGYDFGNVRFGAELRYQRNKINGVTVRTVDGAAASGTLSDDDLVDLAYYLGNSETDFDNVTVNGTSVKTSPALGKIRQLGVMANIYYDIPLGAFEPYLGVGLGAVGTHINTPDDDDGSVRFAWQLLAGAAYKISPKIAITAEYSYRQGSKGKLQFSDEDLSYRLGKTKAQFLGVGLRVGF